MHATLHNIDTLLIDYRNWSCKRFLPMGNLAFDAVFYKTGELSIAIKLKQDSQVLQAFAQQSRYKELSFLMKFLRITLRSLHVVVTEQCVFEVVKDAVWDDRIRSSLYNGTLKHIEEHPCTRTTMSRTTG